MLFLNDTLVKVTKFPDGTSQVWQLPEQRIKNAEIKWVFQSEDEFMHLAQLKDLMDKEGVETSLVITYLPYGRQDKKVDNGLTFALRTFSYLLNSLDFISVLIRDPHSEIALGLIHNSKAYYLSREVSQLFKDTKMDLMCFPDKGALNKYSSIYKETPYIYGEKVRDQLTGRITSYKVIGNEAIANKKILIVDDICDGGATFKLLAAQLIKNGAAQVDLFVSHGLFTQGLEGLWTAGISNIFCFDKLRDSIITKTTEEEFEKYSKLAGN
jgi:ribose-phosphate pyrophosphokinase